MRHDMDAKKLCAQVIGASQALKESIIFFTSSAGAHTALKAPPLGSPKLRSGGFSRMPWTAMERRCSCRSLNVSAVLLWISATELSYSTVAVRHNNVTLGSTAIIKIWSCYSIPYMSTRHNSNFKKPHCSFLSAVASEPFGWMYKNKMPIW